MKQNKQRGGFTLLELMAVLIIKESLKNPEVFGVMVRNFTPPFSF